MTKTLGSPASSEDQLKSDQEHVEGNLDMLLVHWMVRNPTSCTDRAVAP